MLAYVSKSGGYEPWGEANEKSHPRATLTSRTNLWKGHSEKEKKKQKNNLTAVVRFARRNSYKIIREQTQRSNGSPLWRFPVPYLRTKLLLLDYLQEHTDSRATKRPKKPCDEPEKSPDEPPPQLCRLVPSSSGCVSVSRRWLSFLYDIREVVSFNGGQRSLKNLSWNKTPDALALFFALFIFSRNSNRSLTAAKERENVR